MVGLTKETIEVAEDTEGKKDTKLLFRNLFSKHLSTKL